MVRQYRAAGDARAVPWFNRRTPGPAAVSTVHPELHPPPPPPQRLAAVLLAAGSGSRLGRRPKCLLELDGVPLLLRLLDALAQAGVAEVVVVLGHHADAIGPVLAGRPERVVHNRDPEADQVVSLRLGLAALDGSADAMIVALADQPLVDAQDLRDLIDAFGARPPATEVLVPQVAGERGNPVIFSAAVRAAVLAGPATFGARQWQAAHPAAVARFVTDNPHYRTDIDTAEDQARFERDTGRMLRWPPALR
jgi:molybdenum cofactor cytidylyltransferase